MKLLLNSLAETENMLSLRLLQIFLFFSFLCFHNIFPQLVFESCSREIWETPRPSNITLCCLADWLAELSETVYLFHFISIKACWEQEGHPKSIILLQWIGVLIACSKHHLEAAVFSKYVSVLVAQWGFSLTGLMLKESVIPASVLQAQPHSACHLGQDGWQAAPGSDPWLVCWPPENIHVLYEATTVGKRISVYIWVCVCTQIFMCIYICLYIYRCVTEKMTTLQEYFTAIRQVSVLKLSVFFSGEQMLSPLVWGSVTNFEICKKGSFLE